MNSGVVVSVILTKKELFRKAKNEGYIGEFDFSKIKLFFSKEFGKVPLEIEGTNTFVLEDLRNIVAQEPLVHSGVAI